MNTVKTSLLIIGGSIVGIALIILVLAFQFEKRYQNRIYPGVVVDSISFEGKTPADVEAYFEQKSAPLKNTSLKLHFEGHVATISATELNLSYDGVLAATHAASYGHGQTSSHYAFKARSFAAYLSKNKTPLVSVPVVLSYNKEVFHEKLETLKAHIDIAPVEPQFEFDKTTNRVVNFKIGRAGREVNLEKALAEIEDHIKKEPGTSLTLDLPVETVEPKTGDKNIDDLGITELIGSGESYYKGSIPGRVHNVLLASARTTGILIAPGEIFSFNQTLGDITAATGYKSAYIIKNGRTMLDDGGGVCQVSTTIFRAALNAGLEIVERKPHSYRVSYYEQGGFKPGLDATVFSPTVDLKFRNNTDHHILIHAVSDPDNYHLTYEIYGKDDGRRVEISDIKILSQSPAPPPMYQEDPTLQNGEIKQVDFAASGAKTAFDYKVTKGGEVLGDSTFVNNFKPWQAVYLYGPGTAVPTPPPPPTQ